MRNVWRNTFLCLLVAAIFVMPILAVKNDVETKDMNSGFLLDQIDQSQTIADYNYPVGEYGYAQGFIPTLPTLTKVQVFLEKTSGGDAQFQNYYLVIRKDTPDASTYMFQTIPGSYISPGDSWTTFDFSGWSKTLTPGETYYIHFYGVSLTGNNNRVFWYMGDRTNDLYPYGDPYAYNEQTGQWYIMGGQGGTTADFCFITYGEGGGSNNPPNTPSTPSGPSSGDIGATYTYYTSATDPDGDSVSYRFDWDGTYSSWSPLFPSGTTAGLDHFWSQAGTYQVKAQAKDEYGDTSSWSAARTVTIGGGGGNTQPNQPSRPTGETAGKTGTSYSYSSMTTDPDGDQLHYNFSWGDGTYSGWIGPYNSGDTITESHVWNTEGAFSVKVKARDSNGAESVWSDPLTISMPKNIDIHALFIQFLEKHPHLFPILRQILLFLG